MTGSKDLVATPTIVGEHPNSSTILAIYWMVPTDSQRDPYPRGHGMIFMVPTQPPVASHWEIYPWYSMVIDPTLKVSAPPKRPCKASWWIHCTNLPSSERLQERIILNSWMVYFQEKANICCFAAAAQPMRQFTRHVTTVVTVTVDHLRW